MIPQVKRSWEGIIEGTIRMVVRGKWEIGTAGGKGTRDRAG